MDFARPGRGLAFLAVYLTFSTISQAADSAAKYTLRPQHLAGELSRVELALEVGGDVKLSGDKGGTMVLPMSVVANLAYDEQLLPAGKSSDPMARSLRYYGDVRAVIKVDKGGEKPTLDKAHRLIVANKQAKGPVALFCPTSTLSREELDLLDVPGNSLLVDQLLPSEPVALGQSWQLNDDTLAQLLGLDAVSWSDVQCMLSGVSDNVAEIAAAGSLSGAAGGVSTEVELKIRYRFDTGLKRVTYLALLIKEKRAIGHVGPGLDTVAKLLMSIKPLEKSEPLADAQATELAGATADLMLLAYQAQAGAFRLVYPRSWYVTSDDPKLVVMRMVERGELVAQCNISPMPVTSAKPVVLAEFQRDVQTSLGKNFGQFTSASQTTNAHGYSVLRVVATGTVSSLPVEWVYYLLGNDKGQRLSLAFTYEQTAAERFNAADRALISQLRFTEPPTPTSAAKPAAKPAATR